jgi:peptidoglycan-associated lipoprotein
MAPVYFGSNSDQVMPQAAGSLDRTAQWLKINPGVKVAISGNADQRAGEQYNKVLAQKRADAVKGQLVQRGVNPAQLQTRSYGKDRPVCSGASESCYAFNRRVDIQAIG